MKKFISIAVTILVSLTYLLSASALTDEEAVQRKRAYYAGIDSTISLLSDKLGNLSDATIERIIVTSSQDFTSEEAVKENVQSEAGKLTLYTVTVTVQFSARDSDGMQNYVFNHCLPAGTTYDLVLASKSCLTASNYNYAVSYLSDYSLLIGSGIAHTSILGDRYYLDIDLNDYTSSGYSLALPYIKKQNSPFQESQSSAVSTTPVNVAVTTETPAVAPESTSPSQPTSSSASSSPEAESITSSTSASTSSTKTAPSSAYKKVGLMVWIPTNGGKRYHRNSSCSGMINPRRVDLGEARYLGFTACGRCYR